jgi:Coenzyme PQQ synthesis protein D (PqqD)
MPLEMTTRLVRGDDLPNAPIGDEIVFLNFMKDNYVGLDDIGRRIWELLETPHRVDELCRQLNREYDAAPEQIASDVLPFLEELRNEGLVHVVEA